MTIVLYTDTHTHTHGFHVTSYNSAAVRTSFINFVDVALAHVNLLRWMGNKRSETKITLLPLRSLYCFNGAGGGRGGWDSGEKTVIISEY